MEVREEFVPLNELIRVPKQTANIDMLVDKTFVIYKIEFYTGDFGEYAVVATDQGEYRTSSKVLLKQLKAIQKAMEEKKIKGVRVKLTRRKSSNKRNYYVFE
jgi:hypothetical protein